MKRICVLGATGSIGTSALDVIARHPDRFRVTALSAHHNGAALAELCIRFRPELAVLSDPQGEPELRARLTAAGVPTRILTGAQGLIEAASGSHCDTVIAAIVGSAGLESTLAAARSGKRLLLANKEAVVMAGPLLLEAVRAGGAELLPVDSEHNALYQCLPTGRRDLADAGVRKLILTASGGPFRGWSSKQLAGVSAEQACRHPRWKMGRKISVDSATLMNKGLEVIEAHFLFAASADEIDVVVHPQSIVHSLVQYLDGSVLAQLGNPDMRTALAHALATPQRIDAGVATLDLVQLGRLDFEAPDLNTFRCLALAYMALRAGGTAPTILNAANEEAVASFLDGAISFVAIARIIEDTLDAIDVAPVTDLDALYAVDSAARRHARQLIRTRYH